MRGSPSLVRWVAPSLALVVEMIVSSTAPAIAADAAVSIENFTFKPASVKVRAGTRVTFTNADDIPHSIVAVDGSFHLKALDTGDHESVTLTKPGLYAYFCGLHPRMRGQIAVVP